MYPEIDDVHKKNWVGGNTMCYRKSLWEQRPFDDINIGEDNQFVWTTGGKVSAHNHIDSFVPLLHIGNTSPKHINDTSRWFPESVDKIEEIISRIEKVL